MSLGKANIAGLTLPQQRSEMKSILAGTWPPLKPLPIFKYETPAYRATIDFDRIRGEWVCRKTSLPSNQVQELRGELREITLALPHEEAEELITGAEHPESEKDANRRLQAIWDWQQNYGNGARYFALRDYLSESQRTEMDDSLRLSLTARQLQFNSKNVAYVFDALSTSGGRFANLIELAKRNEARQETGTQPQPDRTVPEARDAIDQVNHFPEISSSEPGLVLPNNDPVARYLKAAAGSTETHELPAVSIKNVFQEQCEAPLAESAPDTSPAQFVIENSKFEDADSLSEFEHPGPEGHPSSALAGFTSEIQADQPSADRSQDASPHSPVLEISGFHLAVFASLFLAAVVALAVGLTVGRGPLGRRLQDVPKSMLELNRKSPAPADNPAAQPTPRTSIPPLTSSDGSANTDRLVGQPSEGKSNENTPGSLQSSGTHSADSNSTPATVSQPSEMPRDSPKASGAVGGRPGNPASSKLDSTRDAAPRLPGTSTILVNVPGRGSHPFRVSFPEKTIAATPSLAMSAQLSVLVSPEPRPATAHKPSRLEAGDLVSVVWPRYPRKADRYRTTQFIRVRATIGLLGQVRDVKFLSGSTSLLPATTRAIRQWHYRPTLLDKRPVEAQQDLTIEFRPQQYSSQAPTAEGAQKLVSVK